MILPILCGLTAGVLGALLSAISQLVVNLPAIYNRLGDSWYLFPMGFGIIAVGLLRIATSRSRGRTPFLQRGLIDIFQAFHFGIVTAGPAQWFARATLTFLNGLFGGVFGMHAAITEFQFALLPAFSKFKRLFLLDKQVFTSSAYASGTSVALGAPMSSALMTIEFLQVNDVRSRTSAIVASMLAWAVQIFIQTAILSRMGVFIPNENSGLLGTLLSGPWNTNLNDTSPLELGAITIVAVVLGALAMAFATFTGKMAVRTRRSFWAVFGARQELLVFVGGICMGAVVFISPESYLESSWLWDDLSWLRFSSPAAIHLLLAKWVLFLFAFSVWGTVGVFMPALTFGALLGYSVGNLISIQWVLPLAVASSAAFLSAIFRLPVSSVALVFEVGAVATGLNSVGSLGSWGLLAWTTLIAVGTSYLLTKWFKTRSFQDRFLEMEGIRLFKGVAGSELEDLPATDAIDPSVAVLKLGLPFKEFCQKVIGSGHPFVSVVDETNRFLGVILIEQLPRRIRKVLKPPYDSPDFTALERVFDLREIVSSQRVLPTRVRPTDSLGSTVESFATAPCLACVDDDDHYHGLLLESSMHRVYRQQVVKKVLQQ